MFKKICQVQLVFSMVLLPLLGFAEQSIVDPMRPPGQSAVSVRVQPGDRPQWQLTQILVSPERRLALINDRLVSVGEKINGAKVTAISSHAVELLVEGRRVVIRPAIHSVRRVRQ